MNPLSVLLKRKKEKLLSIYFTAGFPEKDSTVNIIRSLQDNGIDFLEVGFPFSDPLADGPVIQQTSQQAIKNGMSLDLLLDQLNDAKSEISIPLILMGYLNPVLQAGMENFCRKAAKAGVSGVILPDLPPMEYKKKYRKLFLDNDLHMIFLVTPETSMRRIKMIDSLGSGFIYAVSSSSTTGRQDSFSDEQTSYLKRLRTLDLKNPVMTGFGIHNSTTLKTVWEHSSGAIIGTAYLKSLINNAGEDAAIKNLLHQLKL
ncbi:MAG: tryptophan synthase subunit alpha [Bacteroidales bacterium]